MHHTKRFLVVAAGLVLGVSQGAYAQAAVRIVRNVKYADAAAKQMLDLYLPQGKTGFPIVVSIHGGALMDGDRSEHRFIGQRFAEAGIGAAVISYRLSPAVSHPAHVQDAAAAFRWVKRHAAEYGGSAGNVFVIGHSAGAYLAALV